MVVSHIYIFFFSSFLSYLPKVNQMMVESYFFSKDNYTLLLKIMHSTIPYIYIYKWKNQSESNDGRVIYFFSKDNYTLLLKIMHSTIPPFRTYIYISERIKRTHRFSVTLKLIFSLIYIYIIYCILYIIYIYIYYILYIIYTQLCYHSTEHFMPR